MLSVIRAAMSRPKRTHFKACTGNYAKTSITRADVPSDKIRKWFDKCRGVFMQQKFLE